VETGRQKEKAGEGWHQPTTTVIFRLCKQTSTVSQCTTEFSEPEHPPSPLENCQETCIVADLVPVQFEPDLYPAVHNGTGSENDTW
jgi:hypothetical protein